MSGKNIINNNGYGANNNYDKNAFFRINFTGFTFQNSYCNAFSLQIDKVFLC